MLEDKDCYFVDEEKVFICQIEDLLEKEVDVYDLYSGELKKRF